MTRTVTAPARPSPQPVQRRLQPTVDYTSDGDGLRQSRTVGTTTKQFLWDTNSSLPLLLDDGTNSYLYGPSSAPIAQVNDITGAVKYLTDDLIGSTRLITSSSGSVVGVNIYDEYGNLTSHTGTATSAIGYSGNWTDPDTGLVYLRARDYDPATAQFLTVDPLVDSTRAPYAYTADDPVSRTDPTGQCTSAVLAVPHYVFTPEDFEDNNGTDWIEALNGFLAASTGVLTIAALACSDIPATEEVCTNDVAAAAADNTEEDAAWANRYEADLEADASQTRAANRDALGRFTGSSQGYALDKEEQGLAEYENEVGAPVVRSQVVARVSGADGGRKYDGLVKLPNGTYQGVEIKSGSASYGGSQKAFDSLVSPSNPATAMLNGTAIKITSVVLWRVG